MLQYWRSLRKKQLAFALLACLSMLLLTVLGLLTSAPGLVWIAVMGGLMVVMGYMQLLLHKIDDDKVGRRNDFRQVEALFSLFSIVRVRAPLPSLRGWAASPDFLSIVMSHVLARRPQSVVELGSGTSTVVVAYLLEKLGQGHVTSFDHNKDFAQQTRDLLKLHELEKFATVIHAPLRTREGCGTPGRWAQLGDWYDQTKLQEMTDVDLLVMDGPYDRSPALPVFADKLSAGAVIIADDADTLINQQAIEQWKRTYKHLEVRLVNTEKGTHIMHLLPQTSSQGSRA